MPEDSSPKPGNAMSLGIQVAVGVGLGMAVGWWIDERNGWRPWGTVIGAVVGLIAGMYLMIRDALRMNRN